MGQTLLRTFNDNHEALASVYSANETGTKPVQYKSPGPNCYIHFVFLGSYRYLSTVQINLSN